MHYNYVYRVQSIQNMWDSLLYKLDSRKGTLTRQRDLMTVFNEMDDCLTDMGIIQVISLSIFYVCMNIYGYIYVMIILHHINRVKINSNYLVL